jgi:hypothetical protein
MVNVLKPMNHVVVLNIQMHQLVVKQDLLAYKRIQIIINVFRNMQLIQRLPLLPSLQQFILLQLNNKVIKVINKVKVINKEIKEMVNVQ